MYVYVFLMIYASLLYLGLADGTREIVSHPHREVDLTPEEQGRIIRELEDDSINDERAEFLIKTLQKGTKRANLNLNEFK